MSQTLKVYRKYFSSLSLITAMELWSFPLNPKSLLFSLPVAMSQISSDLRGISKILADGKTTFQHPVLTLLLVRHMEPVLPPNATEMIRLTLTGTSSSLSAEKIIPVAGHFASVRSQTMVLRHFI